MDLGLPVPDPASVWIPDFDTLFFYFTYATNMLGIDLAMTFIVAVTAAALLYHRFIAERGW